MTACNNVQDANLGKKAVSAALAGTLAVGMVPAAALAAEAPEACDGITALTADLVAEYNGAKVTQISLNGAAPEATPTGKIEIAKGTTNLNVVPTQVTSNATGNTAQPAGQGRCLRHRELGSPVHQYGHLCHAGDLPHHDRLLHRSGRG